MITTFFGRPNQEIPALQLWRKGMLEVEVVPQGILAERMRAAGAGLGGVYVPNYVGTVFEEQDTQSFEGREYVLASPLAADFALIGGHRADRLGNLTYGSRSGTTIPRWPPPQGLRLRRCGRWLRWGR